MSCTMPAFRLLSVATLALVFAKAQQPAAASNKAQELTGSVTGYVVYAENQLPARFAEIHLVPRPADLAFTSLVPIKKQPLNSAEPSQTKVEYPRFVVGTTGMDGTFRLNGVPPGDYFVAALKPGYVAPGAATPMDASEEQLKSVVASLTVVSVGAGQVASVNLTLHRGAVISGRIGYADGSPAIGVLAGAGPDEEIRLPANARETTSSPLQNALQLLAHTQAPQPNVLTDDEGRYRTFGLPPGRYLISTMISLDHNSAQVFHEDGSSSRLGREHMYPEIIPAYGPGTFQRKNAKVFEIHGDEQITDADLMIDLNGLHTLRGKVLAADDRHAPSAMVRLRDEAKDMFRFADTENDGSFQLDYLPPGSYTLEVDAIENAGSPDGARQPRTYKAVRLSVVIGDHDVVLDDVLLTVLKPDERNPEFEF